jgi:hypothetical protein
MHQVTLVPSYRNRRTLKAWRSALKYLHHKRLAAVIKEVEQLSPPKNIDQILSGYAWMVWVSGFSEETIERKWPSLKKAFSGFRANQILAKNQEDPGFDSKVSRRYMAHISDACKDSVGHTAQMLN